MEVIKIVRLTSLLPDMPRLASPKPRLRQGSQHARLSPNHVPKSIYYLFQFYRWIFFLIKFFSKRFQLFFSEGVGIGLHRLPKIPFFRFLAKALGNKARGSDGPRAFRSLNFFSCSTFTSDKFLAAATNFFSPPATVPDKLAYPMLKYLPR